MPDALVRKAAGAWNVAVVDAAADDTEGPLIEVGAKTRRFAGPSGAGRVRVEVGVGRVDVGADAEARKDGVHGATIGVEAELRQGGA